MRFHVRRMNDLLSSRIVSWRAATTTTRVCSLSPCFRQAWGPGSSFCSQQSHSTKPAAPVEYEHVDGAENLSDYRPGGYHPIHIDDSLDKRYRVVHKLGYGTFSKVWLAINEETSKYVAIKVGTADADRTEIDILSRLTESAVGYSEDERSLIPNVLDHFDISGPNGNHQSLVTIPARCSLQDAREASGSSLFQLDVARSLAAQLVVAVSLVHSQGYAHGGEQPCHRLGRQQAS